MDDMALWHKCEAEGCSVLFVPVRGKRFHSGACRAKASDEASFRRRLAHKVPVLTVERRGVQIAAKWLRDRI